MTTIRTLLTAAAALALAGALAPASAQNMPAPQQRVPTTLSYQNGGIGKDQVEKMEHNAKPYNLRMTFSEGKQNAYATGLHLRIVDAKGLDVFSLADAGPHTDVKLPPGKYRVMAKFGGVERSAEVLIKPDGPTMLNMHWPKDET